MVGKFLGVPPGWRAACAEAQVPLEAIAAYDDIVRNHVRVVGEGTTITLDDVVLLARTAEPILLRDAVTEYTFVGDMLRRDVLRQLMDVLVGPGLPLVQAGDGRGTKV